jgi:phage-related protein
MLINNIDISNFKAKLLKKDIQTAEITIFDDWLRNASDPLYLGKKETYKKIKIELLIEDTDDESCINDISNLVKQFQKCTIKFDDLSYFYNCTIVSKLHEKSVSCVYTLDVELKSGYAYKTAILETLNHVASKTINVQGNTETPCIVTITVPIDTISITLTGFREDPIIIKNLKANIPVILDGETCTVLQAGLNKFGETDFWEYPTLQPGANTIGVSTANSVINISYKPKFI